MQRVLASSTATSNYTKAMANKNNSKAVLLMKRKPGFFLKKKIVTNGFHLEFASSP
jgi:hypothetical protein